MNSHAHAPAHAPVTSRTTSTNTGVTAGAGPIASTGMSNAALRDLHERKCRAVARRPAFAQSSGQACVHLTHGLACEVHHEDHLTAVDLPESEGGTGSAPTPGQLLRASLGACLAMGYRLWGARLGVDIEAVDIEITCAYDVRGQFGLSAETAIGWQRVAFHVAVVSAAPEAAVRRVVETADRLSPMLANLSTAVERTHRLTILTPRSYARPGTVAGEIGG